jgi:hypothetical protein
MILYQRRNCPVTRTEDDGAAASVTQPCRTEDLSLIERMANPYVTERIIKKLETYSLIQTKFMATDTKTGRMFSTFEFVCCADSQNVLNSLVPVLLQALGM